MKHYIITRFNLGLYNTDKDHGSWMKTRLGIFLTFTLPSVLNQDTTNFTWLLGVDAKTPPEYYDILKAEAIAHPNIILTDNFRKHIEDGDNTYLYTILENDDAIPIDYIRKAQEIALQHSPPFFIDVPIMFRVSEDFIHYQAIYQHLFRLIAPQYSAEVFTVVEDKPLVPRTTHDFTYQTYPKMILMDNACVQIIHRLNEYRRFDNNHVFASPIIHGFPQRIMSRFGWTPQTPLKIYEHSTI